MQSNPQPNSGDSRVLIIPSAGMGHLIPFVSLATNLSAHRIPVSLLVPRPTVSSAESLLLSSLPPSLIEDLPLAPLPPSQFFPSSDPFLLRMEAIRRSAHLLRPLITSSSSPISSLVVDISIASTFIPFAASLNIPCSVLFTCSAAMLALCSVYPFSSPGDADIDIAGILRIPSSSLPQPLHDPSHFFKAQFIENGKALTQASTILVNTFTALEPIVLAKLNSGEVVQGLPPVIAVGPLQREKPSWTSSPAMRWLDEQPRRSVIYVSFGSRTAMSREQARELGAGLEMSGCRFLWVMKSKMVDREEHVGEIEEMVGEGYVKRVGGRGLVVMEWVEQDAILGHPAVAGFVSHCGWNSAMEAAAAGVRVLAWPRGGDQRVNAAVVAESGIGVWPAEWVWEGEEGVVAAEEIAKKVTELFEDEKVGEAAAKMAKEAEVAVAEGLGLGKWLRMSERKVSL